MSADTVNLVMQGGRLGSDAEVRYTQNGDPIVHFRLAVSLRERVDGEWQDATNWWRVTCFGKLAERYQERPLLKGQRVMVTGRMEKATVYTSERGTGVSLGIVANEVARYDFDESQQQVDAGRQPRQQRQPAAASANRAPKAEEEIQDLEDLPF
jgi:single-strand DNA-binding protein